MEVKKKYGMEDKKYDTVFDKAWSESKEVIHSSIKEKRKRIRTEIRGAVEEYFRCGDMGIEEKEKLFSSLVKQKEDEVGIPQYQQMFDRMNLGVSDLIVNMFIPLARKESDIDWRLSHHLSKDELKRELGNIKDGR